jgi:hypothetical protein
MQDLIDGLKRNARVTPRPIPQDPDPVADAREALGSAIRKVDVAREQIAAGAPADMGAIITDLERAEKALDEAETALDLARA